MGLGPGDPALLAPMALRALADAEVIGGYTTYLELIDPRILDGKHILETGMRKEMDRARAVVRAAMQGRRVVMVSGGDAGVYGMAGLVFEVAELEGALGRIEIEVVPGIPAVVAAAALLGAPLMHDFAAVSLSDLLTPWNLIEKRLDAAAGADFVLALYNPRSRRRDWQLPRALEIIAAHRAPETPVGHVLNAYRGGQQVRVTTLEGIMIANEIERIGMLSILVVGNSSTRLAGGRMITPRGYLDKYGCAPESSPDAGSGSTQVPERCESHAC